MAQKLFLQNKFLVCLAVLFFCISCTNKNKNSDAKKTVGPDPALNLFSAVSPGSSGVSFINTVEETQEKNIFTYQYIYNGSGVAAGDINNDGLPDLFFSGNMVPCRLYLNKGNFKFEDITEKAGIKTGGWCTGVSMVDVNNDGFLDIYVCRSSVFESPQNRRNLLFINNGNGTFSEKAKSFGLDNDGYSTQATFFDYDHDGDLDMYLVNHAIDWNFKITSVAQENAKIDPMITHRLYRNNGNNTFTDVTKEAGLLCNSYGLSASVGDLDGDGWDDIYATNDYNMPDFLYINNHNGTFTDKCLKMIRHMPNFSMGSDIADFNNDGLLDIIALDMLPESNKRQKILFGPQNFDKFNLMLKGGYGCQFMQNCLQVNNGNGTFSEVAELAGVAKTDWSWAPLLADFDNDGNKDLYVTNGFLHDFTDLDFTMYRAEELRKGNGIEHRLVDLVKKMPSTKLRNYMYRNNGNMTFTDASDAWGLTEKTVSNGATYADLDGDGDLDLVVCNINDTVLIYRNNAETLNSNHFIRIKLTGNEKNPFAVGTRVKVSAGKTEQLQQLIPVRGYQSSVDYTLVFGLGSNTNIDKIEVDWYDGKNNLYTNIHADTTLKIKYADASFKKGIHEEKKPAPVFAEDEKRTKINFTHKENPYIDFKREPLLTHQESQNGPGIAVGDVNGDGREDFYVGGAQDQAGVLFLQQADGTFQASQSGQPFEADKKYEDMGSLFFDADNDGDLDLYVVSGGTTENGDNPLYQDRLYINDGKGKFTRSKDALPVMNTSGSCVVAGDYDGDGDLDLFVGGRIVPSQYPYAVRSYLLRNDGGKFKDVTHEVAPDLEYPGLVTSALWTDFNNDNKPDLVVTGEWMPVLFLENQNGTLKSIFKGSGLEYSNGWWNSIIGADFDHDGDIDYVVGNYGLNSKIKASREMPATIVYKDFDGNGTNDAILSYYQNDGRSYPWCSRDDFTDQMRVMKKNFLRYADYADKTIQEIFTPEELKDAKTLDAYTFASCYIENLGNGHFKISPLPLQAQCSPVYGMTAGDFNEDGNMDVLLTGNFFSENINIGRNDAGNGLLLTGDGHGNFKPLPLAESGFFTSGDAKALATVFDNSSNRMLMLVSNNDSKMQSFECMQTKKNNVVKTGKDDSRITWEDKNGKKNLVEIYHGSGYLSQASGIFILPPDAVNIFIFDKNGKAREINNSKASAFTPKK